MKQRTGAYAGAGMKAAGRVGARQRGRMAVCYQLRMQPAACHGTTPESVCVTCAMAVCVTCAMAPHDKPHRSAYISVPRYTNITAVLRTALSWSLRVGPWHPVCAFTATKIRG